MHSAVSPSPGFELALLRKSVGALTDKRALCVHCHRTPLIGERVYLYGERHRLRALPAAPPRGSAGHASSCARRSTPARSACAVSSGNTAGAVDPIELSINIDRPREEVFEYLADIANHPEFTDHYLKEWRLTRVDSYGRGAGARFRTDAPRQRFAWGDMSFVTVEPPRRIVGVGRGGKFNRIKTFAEWTLEPAGHGTRLDFVFETEPALADRSLHRGVRLPRLDAAQGEQGPQAPARHPRGQRGTWRARDRRLASKLRRRRAPPPPSPAGPGGRRPRARGLRQQGRGPHGRRDRGHLHRRRRAQVPGPALAHHQPERRGGRAPTCRACRPGRSRSGPTRRGSASGSASRTRRTN